MKPASLPLKIVCSGLAVILFSQTAFAHKPEVNFWAERGLVTRQNVILSEAKDLQRSFVANAPQDDRVALTQFGTLRNLVPQSSGRTLIHIQDVHANAEAQKNISGALQALIQQGKVDLIALEGAFGPVSLAPFREFPDQLAIHNAADQLLQANDITGPIQALLTLPVNQPLPPVMGVDDADHYQANVRAVKTSSPLKEKQKAAVAAFQKDLDQKKETVFNQDLRTFDQVVSAYRNGQIEMRDYAAALAMRRGELPPAIKHFNEAVRLEKGLDQPRIEQERTVLVAELVARLTSEETNRLTSTAAAFNAGLIRHAEFYGRLKELCESKKLSFSKFPAMAGYLQYVLLSESIDGEKLNAELQNAENEIYARLAKSSDEKELLAKSRRLYLAERLIEFALTKPEWEEYKSAPALVEAKPFEDFYREAEIRDQKMAENLARAAERYNAKNIVLVTGGFHARGIKTQVNGYSIASFVPKISKVDTANGSAYLSVFTREKTPLEKLFEGQKLFLTEEPLSPFARLKGAILTAAGSILSSAIISAWLEKFFGLTRVVRERLGEHVVVISGYVGRQFFRIQVDGMRIDVKRSILSRLVEAWDEFLAGLKNILLPPQWAWASAVPDGFLYSVGEKKNSKPLHVHRFSKRYQITWSKNSGAEGGINDFPEKLRRVLANKKTAAERVVAIYFYLNWSDAQLKRKARVAMERIGELKNDRDHVPQEKTLFNIAKALNISPVFLLTGLGGDEAYRGKTPKERIRLLMYRDGINIPELAEKTGISRSATRTNLNLGRGSQLTRPLIHRYAAAFNESPAFVETGFRPAVLIDRTPLTVDPYARMILKLDDPRRLEAAETLLQLKNRWTKDGTEAQLEEDYADRLNGGSQGGATLTERFYKASGEQLDRMVHYGLISKKVAQTFFQNKRLKGPLSKDFSSSLLRARTELLELFDEASQWAPPSGVKITHVWDLVARGYNRNRLLALLDNTTADVGWIKSKLAEVSDIEARILQVQDERGERNGDTSLSPEDQRFVTAVRRGWALAPGWTPNQNASLYLKKRSSLSARGAARERIQQTAQWASQQMAVHPHILDREFPRRTFQVGQWPFDAVPAAQVPAVDFVLRLDALTEPAVPDSQKRYQLISEQLAGLNGQSVIRFSDLETFSEQIGIEGKKQEKYSAAKKEEWLKTISRVSLDRLDFLLDQSGAWDDSDGRIQMKLWELFDQFKGEELNRKKVILAFKSVHPIELATVSRLAQISGKEYFLLKSDVVQILATLGPAAYPVLLSLMKESDPTDQIFWRVLGPALFWEGNRYLERLWDAAWGGVAPSDPVNLKVEYEERIVQAYLVARGNKTTAANALGVGPKYLRSVVRKLRVEDLDKARTYLIERGQSVAMLDALHIADIIPLEEFKISEIMLAVISAKGSLIDVSRRFGMSYNGIYSILQKLLPMSTIMVLPRGPERNMALVVAAQQYIRDNIIPAHLYRAHQKYYPGQPFSEFQAFEVYFNGITPKPQDDEDPAGALYPLAKQVGVFWAGFIENFPNYAFYFFFAAPFVRSEWYWKIFGPYALVFIFIMSLHAYYGAADRNGELIETVTVREKFETSFKATLIAMLGFVPLTLVQAAAPWIPADLYWNFVGVAAIMGGFLHGFGNTKSGRTWLVGPNRREARQNNNRLAIKFLTAAGVLVIFCAGSALYSSIGGFNPVEKIFLMFAGTGVILALVVLAFLIKADRRSLKKTLLSLVIAAGLGGMAGFMVVLNPTEHRSFVPAPLDVEGKTVQYDILDEAGYPMLVYLPPNETTASMEISLLQGRTSGNADANVIAVDSNQAVVQAEALSPADTEIIIERKNGQRSIGKMSFGWFWEKDLQPLRLIFRSKVPGAAIKFKMHATTVQVGGNQQDSAAFGALVALLVSALWNLFRKSDPRDPLKAVTPKMVEAMRAYAKKYLQETRLLEVPQLRPDVDKRDFVKMESDQPTGSFKDRNALQILYWFDRMTPEERAQIEEIVVESTGNQGRAVAHMVQYIKEHAEEYPGLNPNLKTVVFTHVNIPQIKRFALEELGADIRADYSDYDAAHEAVKQYKKEKNREKRRVLHVEHASPWALAAYATLAYELIDQLNSIYPDLKTHPITVAVPTGSGGLASGLAIGFHLAGYDRITIVPIQTEEVNGMDESVQKTTVVRKSYSFKTIVDGIVATVEPLALQTFLKFGLKPRIVTEEQAMEGTRRLIDATGDTLEGSAGLGPAAGLEDTDVVHIATGKNIDPETLAHLWKGGAILLLLSLSVSIVVLSMKGHNTVPLLTGISAAAVWAQQEWQRQFPEFRKRVRKTVLLAWQIDKGFKDYLLNSNILPYLRAHTGATSALQLIKEPGIMIHFGRLDFLPDSVLASPLVTKIIVIKFAGMKEHDQSLLDAPLYKEAIESGKIEFVDIQFGANSHFNDWLNGLRAEINKANSPRDLLAKFPGLVDPEEFFKALNLPGDLNKQAVLVDSPYIVSVFIGLVWDGILKDAEDRFGSRISSSEMLALQWALRADFEHSYVGLLNRLAKPAGVVHIARREQSKPLWTPDWDLVKKESWETKSENALVHFESLLYTRRIPEEKPSQLRQRSLFHAVAELALPTAVILLVGTLGYHVLSSPALLRTTGGFLASGAVAMAFWSGHPWMRKFTLVLTPLGIGTSPTVTNAEPHVIEAPTTAEKTAIKTVVQAWGRVVLSKLKSPEWKAQLSAQRQATNEELIGVMEKTIIAGNFDVSSEIEFGAEVTEKERLVISTDFLSRENLVRELTLLHESVHLTAHQVMRHDVRLLLRVLGGDAAFKREVAIRVRNEFEAREWERLYKAFRLGKPVDSSLSDDQRLLETFKLCTNPREEKKLREMAAGKENYEQWLLSWLKDPHYYEPRRSEKRLFGPGFSVVPLLIVIAALGVGLFGLVAHVGADNLRYFMVSLWHYSFVDWHKATTLLAFAPVMFGLAWTNTPAYPTVKAINKELARRKRLGWDSYAGALMYGKHKDRALQAAAYRLHVRLPLKGAKYTTIKLIKTELNRRKALGWDNNAAELQSGEHPDSGLYQAAMNKKISLPKIAALYPTRQSVRDELARRKKEGVSNSATALRLGKHQNSRLAQRMRDYGIKPTPDRQGAWVLPIFLVIAALGVGLFGLVAHVGADNLRYFLMNYWDGWTLAWPRQAVLIGTSAGTWAASAKIASLLDRTSLRLGVGQKTAEVRIVSAEEPVMVKINGIDMPPLANNSDGAAELGQMLANVHIRRVKSYVTENAVGSPVDGYLQDQDKKKNLYVISYITDGLLPLMPRAMWTLLNTLRSIRAVATQA